MAYKLSQSIDFRDLSSDLQEEVQDDLCVANDLAYKLSLRPSKYPKKYYDRLCEELKALGVNFEMEYCYINFSW